MVLPSIILPDWSIRSISADVNQRDRKSTRLNSSHTVISYAVFCLTKQAEASEAQSFRPIAFRPLLEKRIPHDSSPTHNRSLQSSLYHDVFRGLYPQPSALAA